ncbi:hypothetical protein [Natrinema sp. SYSU A 869]|uniref:hypothetical protein n=1 Tax=Natrinema sp. SYSU A 869 TaxID=2871694 RepID=UPI001CA4150A|nr:hypothetical protein [Natrinema sp. SYSU A 869]
MTVTITLDENENIDLTDTDIENRAPDRLAVTIEGQLTVTDALLAEFEGAALDPVRITVAVEDAEPIAIDLMGPASLRLENVDVGVATPDEDAIGDGLDALESVAGDSSESSDTRPDVIAFTVDGVIRDVPATTIEAIAGGDPTLESLTFAVEESLESDGGSGSDVLFELALLGYGIVVHRDGTIVVDSGGRSVSIDRA